MGNSHKTVVFQKSKFKWMVVFLFVMHCLIDGESKSWSRDEIDEMFSSYKGRTEPLHYCNGDVDGFKFRIPEIVNCAPLPDAKNNSKAVIATIFVENVEDRPIPAKECFGKRHKFERYYTWFFGVNSVDNAYEPEDIYINSDSCKSMVSNKRSPDGSVMERLYEGSYGTKNIVEPTPWDDVSYREMNIKIVDNYYFRKLDIFQSNIGDEVTTSVALKDKCKVQDGSCFSNSGIIVWDSSIIPKCKIKEAGTSACLLTQDKLSCPDLEYVFSKVNTTKLCGKITAGYCEQGFVIGTQYSDEIVGAASTDDIRKSLNLPRNRRKRNTETGIMEPSLITDQELNARFNYIHEIVRDGHNFDIEALHGSICRSQQQRSQLAHYMAENGDPSALARMYLGDKSVRATLMGDIVAVHKCQDIFDYYFLENETENGTCTLEWPIKFVANHDHFDGYLSPFAKSIVMEATIIDCPPPPFYFDMKEDVILLNNKELKPGITIMPNAASFTNPRLMPEMSFKRPGINKASAFMNTKAMLAVMRQQNERFMLDAAIEKQGKGQVLNEGEKRAWSSFSGLIGGPFMKYIYIAYGTILVLGILVGLLVLRIYWDPISKYFGCCCKCCKSNGKPVQTNTNVTLNIINKEESKQLKKKQTFSTPTAPSYEEIKLNKPPSPPPRFEAK